MLRSSATSPVDFDWQRLRQLAGEDAAFEHELLGLFLQDAEDMLQELDQAIAVQCVASTESVAHALRGASANVGAIALSAAALQLEQIARQGSLQGARGHLQQVSHHYRRVKAHLQSRLRG
ncbi:MAG: Hpt domain-containing protein [Cyanobacteria bacterium J06614_10]